MNPNKMNRRNLLTTCAAAVAGSFAGCNTSSEASEAENTPTSTDPPGTPDQVDEAITAARSKLDSALRSVEDMEVIVDGRIGIVTETKFAEASEVESEEITEPIVAARERLSGIEDDAKGERAERIEAILGVASYTNTKYREYLALVQAFSYLDFALQAFAERQAQDALAMVQTSRTNVETALEHHQSAIEVLATLEESVSHGVPEFEVYSERNDQEYISTLLSRWKPGMKGIESYLRALLQTGNAFEALQNGTYPEAETRATRARSNFIDASEELGTAIEQDVEVFGTYVAGFECQSEGFIDISDTLVEAARAGNDGDEKRADELTSKADSRVDEVLDTCSPRG